ncbi:MAG: hypothetical protein K6E35_01810 [Bacteroidales bacterium]|nr:hypothetical protein [Bacteroidales bacterium]
MRKILVLTIVALALLPSCRKNADQEIFCELTLEAVLPSGEIPVALKVDNARSGNYFRNLNTGTEYPIPLFVNGRCRMQILKGVYVVSFDGVAGLADGSGIRVRSAEHSTTLTAVSLIDDQTELPLNLIVLR